MFYWRKIDNKGQMEQIGKVRSVQKDLKEKLKKKEQEKK